MAKRKKKPVTLAHVATGAKSLKVEMVEVEDPYDESKKGFITVARNLTPLTELYNRRVIDISERVAGERFAINYERAELGGAQAIDYTREHVDGGLTPEPLSEQQQEALDWLRRVARYPGIGKNGFALLRAICGEGRTITACARQAKWLTRDPANLKRAIVEEHYVRLRLSEALGCLVDFLKLNGEGPTKGRIRSETGDNLNEIGGEYEIDRFGDVVLKKRA